MKSPKVKESYVKTKVKEILKPYKQEEKLWYCMPQSGGFGKGGVPDFIICVTGRFLTIETKAGNNKPTELQNIEMDKIKRAKGIALVINEDNLHLIKPVIESVIEINIDDLT